MAAECLYIGDNLFFCIPAKISQYVPILFVILSVFMLWQHTLCTDNRIEKGVPQSFCTVQSNELSSSEEFYKEGKRSLAWQFSPRSVLTVKLDTPLHLDSISKEKRGITLWIYNEQARKDSLCFEFFSPTGHISYRFGFRLNAQGWRACWIALPT